MNFLILQRLHTLDILLVLESLESSWVQRLRLLRSRMGNRVILCKISWIARNIWQSLWSTLVYWMDTSSNLTRLVVSETRTFNSGLVVAILHSLTHSLHLRRASALCWALIQTVFEEKLSSLSRSLVTVVQDLKLVVNRFYAAALTHQSIFGGSAETVDLIGLLMYRLLPQVCLQMLILFSADRLEFWLLIAHLKEVTIIQLHRLPILGHDLLFLNLMCARSALKIGVMEGETCFAHWLLMKTRLSTHEAHRSLLGLMNGRIIGCYQLLRVYHW